MLRDCVSVVCTRAKSAQLKVCYETGSVFIAAIPIVVTQLWQLIKEAHLIAA